MDAPITSADYRIKSAKADSETHHVELVWSTGDHTVADFSRYIGNGVFGKLSDPEIFKKVSTKHDGHVLTWPGDLDFSADDLWYEAHPEDIPEKLRAYFPPGTFRHLELK